MKQLYEKLTPYIQIIGWWAVLIPTSYSMWSLVSDARAFGDRISALEDSRSQQASEISNIHTKLDLIIQYTKPRK